MSKLTPSFYLVLAHLKLNSNFIAALATANIPAVEPCTYDFPITDVTSFMALAQIIEG